jgi:hypothetical protein
VNSLTNLLDTPQRQISKLTQGGMNELEKLLHINSKSSSLLPNLNLEAQVLSGGEVLPAAAPEPATWLLFLGLAAGAGILQRRLFAGMRFVGET